MRRLATIAAFAILALFTGCGDTADTGGNSTDAGDSNTADAAECDGWTPEMSSRDGCDEQESFRECVGSDQYEYVVECAEKEAHMRNSFEKFVGATATTNCGGGAVQYCDDPGDGCIWTLWNHEDGEAPYLVCDCDAPYTGDFECPE